MEKKLSVKKFTIREWVLAGFALLLLVWLFAFIFRAVRIPGTDPMYDYLQHQNDSLLRIERQARIDRRKAEDSLKNIISNIDSRIDTIKTAYEKKVFIYDNYSPEQLEEYFSNRYSRPGR